MAEKPKDDKIKKRYILQLPISILDKLDGGLA